MKSFILENKKSFIAIIIILLLFGLLKIYENGSKVSTLSCENNQSLSFGSNTISIVIKEKSNKKEVNMENKLIYTSKIENSEINDLIKSTKKDLNAESKNIKYDVDLKNNTLFITLKAIATQDNEIELTKIFDTDIYQSTLEEIKSDFEEDGLKCVIK